MDAAPRTVGSSEPVGFAEGHASFDLEPVLWPDGDALHGVAAFATRLLRRATVERLMARFLEALEALAADY